MAKPLTVTRPFDPKYLWNTGPNTAELDTNFGDKGAYVVGFLDAARHLAEQLEAGHLGVDVVIYPALYLLRHGLELGFKALLSTYHYELENEDRSSHGHSLASLWKQLEPQLDPPSYASDHGQYFAPEAVQYIGGLVKAIHDVDPDGEAARYDVNLDDTPTLVGVKRVNLSVLSDVCAVAAEWMQGTLHHRHEVENFLRHQRDYFKLPGRPKGPASYDRDRKPFVAPVLKILQRAAQGNRGHKQYLTSYQIFARLPKGLRFRLVGTKGVKSKYGREPDAGPKVVADIIKLDLRREAIETERISARGISFRVDRTEPTLEAGPTAVLIYRLPTIQARRTLQNPSG